MALKKRLAERNAFQPVDTTLTPDRPFPALVDYRLADLDLEGRISPATRFNYERNMCALVLPAFRGCRSGAIGRHQVADPRRRDALLQNDLPRLEQWSHQRDKCDLSALCRKRPE